MSRQHLVIIDPQNDFCDLPKHYLPFMPGGNAQPALPVSGAHEDMLRLAETVRRCCKQFIDISLTLDTHHNIDIAHPQFWLCDARDYPVSPFTQITAEDVRAGRYRPRAASALPRVLAYLEALESNGRYIHTIWPTHCVIGSWGHCIHPDIYSACAHWEIQHQRSVDIIFKGMNPWTEHYSAVMAEIPNENDQTTKKNEAWLHRLAEADRIYIAGEAGSHCVRATCEHLVQYIGQSNIHKLTILKDCMSPVSGFEEEQSRFLTLMSASGVSITTSEALE